MKKMVMNKVWVCALIILALVVFTSPAQAQQTEQGNTYVYHNIAIYKIRDYRDAYIITYAKHDRGTGQLIVPKHWVKGTPAKLTVRHMPKQIEPYMSVYYSQAGFDHIVLTIPASSRHNMWGGVVKGDGYGDNSTVATLEKFEY